MKTLTKIVIIIVFLFAAIGGVMFYAKTRVEPPVATKQANQYVKDLQQIRKDLLTVGSMAQKDSVFELALDRTLTFWKEDRIESSKMDLEMDELLNAYIPFFVKDSYNKFSQSVWHESDHERMLKVIAELGKVTHADNKPALNKSQKDSLSYIRDDVIMKYREAKALCQKTTFKSVREAEKWINQARQYANDTWLKNCTSLVKALNNIKPALAQSHYNFVRKEIDKLSLYREQSEEFYMDKLLPRVRDFINEYDNNATKLYGSKRDVNDLRSRMNNYRKEAESYYLAEKNSQINE